MTTAGIVLGGGGARAAYEAGVLHYVVYDVARTLGREIPIDIVCGTSAGAINAACLAAFADEPRRGVDRLVDAWQSLKIQDVIRPDAHGILGMTSGLVSDARRREQHRGVIDATRLERLLTEAIPFGRIASQIAAGRLRAVSLSATSVRSGRTAVFVQRSAERALPSWGRSATIEAKATTLGVDHVMASAAIPFLFPAVSIDGQLYCDGGLRQNMPLSPARRLGADALLVVSSNPAAATSPAGLGRDRERVFSGPTFLLGKALNALLLDRIEDDVARLERVSEILAAGTREYGAEFIETLNRQLDDGGAAPLQAVESMVVRPSESISALAAGFMQSSRFLRGRQLGARLFRRLVEGGREADLASYLLFDGHFAAELIALGRADARRCHAPICLLFHHVLANRNPHRRAS